MAKTQSYTFDSSRNVIVFPDPRGDDYPGIELDINAIAVKNRQRAELHGWHARINDTAAIGVADKDGKIIPAAERARMKAERMNELCRFYESGTEDWSRVSEGGGGMQPIAVLAFARSEGIEPATARERMERVAKLKDRSWKEQLAITEKLYPEEVKAIQAERNKTPVSLDIDAELAALKGE